MIHYYLAIVLNGFFRYQFINVRFDFSGDYLFATKKKRKSSQCKSFLSLWIIIKVVVGTSETLWISSNLPLCHVIQYDFSYLCVYVCCAIITHTIVLAKLSNDIPLSVWSHQERLAAFCQGIVLSHLVSLTTPLRWIYGERKNLVGTYLGSCLFVAPDGWRKFNNLFGVVLRGFNQEIYKVVLQNFE